MIYPGPTLYPGAPNAYPSYSEPATQLPNAVMEFQGMWNASTNTPTLADGSNMIATKVG